MENIVALWLIPVFLWKNKICIILHFIGLSVCEAYGLKSKKEIWVRNKYLMAFTCFPVDVATYSINTKLQRGEKSLICQDCKYHNNVNMMKLQTQAYQENIVTVA